MSAVVWFWAVAVCAVWGARGEISHNMNTLSRHLQRDMADVMELAAVNYSEPVINTTYRASVEFDMRAMGPLYNSTHMLIDLIAHKQAYPEGIVTIQDGNIEVASPKEEWRPLLAHYAGPASLLTVAVLLAALLPLAGLFWCCCYWCRVGRRRRPFDRKYDSCLKGLLAIIFIALLTLFLFGVVCLFATDAQVESGAAEAPASVRVGVSDAREFLNATQAHVRWLLVVNWHELADRLNAVLLTSGVMVSSKLGEFSRAVSVTTLNSLVLKLDDVQADLRRVRSHTDKLREHADTLNAGLRKVKNQLLQTLANCDQPKCLALQSKYNIGQLNTEIHYSQMPDVSELLNNVTALLDTNIKEEVGAGQQVFRDIQAGIRRSVQEHIPAVQRSISETGARLESIANEITYMTGNASEELRELTVADVIEKYHREYGPYRRYIGLAAAIAPLLITCIFAWGLTCGVCGKRPDVYGASDCCNKGAGSKCLLCGVGLIFILGGAMALVLAVYFTVGVAAQRFVCDPLTEPRDNRLFDDMEKFVDLEKVMFKQNRDPYFNMTTVMLRCHRNNTMYKTLELHRLYDLKMIRAELANWVESRVGSLQPTFPTDTPPTILRRAAKEKLTQLANTGLSDFNFDRILHALESNMTSLALDSLAKQLDSTARSLTQPQFAAEAESLARAAATLRDLLHNVLTPMLNYTVDLNTTAIRLRDELRFNHKSLKEAIHFLMRETHEAEVFLSTQGPRRLQNITQEYAAVIMEKLDEYLDRVTHAAEHEVGRCGPLSNAFNATRDAACNKILMPTNGYWIALAWCVVLFVPLMLVAQRLARLYLHADPYPGPLVEAEYLYDAYADRDNVPLANGSKRSTLDIEGKIAEWRERNAPSAPPGPAPPASPPHSGSRLLLAGGDVVCQLLPPPAALITDLKTRFDAKDEDNESGIHESE